MDYLGDQYEDFLNDPELAKYRTKDDTIPPAETPKSSWSPNWSEWGKFGTTVLNTGAQVASRIIELKAMEKASNSEVEKAELRQQIAYLQQQKVSNSLDNESGNISKGALTKGVAIGGTVLAGVLALAALK